MIYKRLNLLSFGKFKNKQIHLESGINLLLGNNEAGKSTIQHFIQGMFYGFFTYGKKRRGYEELQEKYKPWNSDDYAGGLLYEEEGKEYFVERNFSDISPRVKVSDFLTGEDITDEFSFDDVNRVYMPSDHLNLSKVMFKNTVSIDQVGAKTEENLAEEVNNLMANMDTGFGDISIHKAIKDLRSAAEKIAGKRGEVRQIGQLNQILEKIMQEKDNTEAIIQNDKQRKMKIDYLQEQLQRIQESELAEKVKLVNKYEEILENIQDTKAKLAQLHHVDSVNEEAYEQVLRLENDVNKELEALKNLKEKIDSVEHAIEKMHAELSQYEQLRDINEIRQDYALYQQLKEGAYRKKPSRLENIVLIACIVFALLSIFFIFKNMVAATIISLLIMIAAFVYTFLARTTNEDVRNSDICRKYGFADEKAFESYYAATSEAYEKYTEKRVLFESKLEEYTALKEEAVAAKTRYEESHNSFLGLLGELGLENSASYREVLKNNKLYQQLKTELEHLEMLQEQTMTEAEYALLKAKTENVEINVLNAAPMQEVPVEAKEEILSEISRLKGMSDEATQNMRSMTEIMTQIKELNHQRDVLLLEYGALNLAADVIEEVARDMHTQNSPVLNDKVSALIYKITDKYTAVKLTDELNIVAENPQTGFLISSDNLSIGTLEQLYFALRIALADLFAPNVPLMFDESFVMYDFKRLENVLRLLYTISQKRQIILFSCSDREKQIMDAMNIPYNLIVME
ncbi:MAG: ATP-binding protein [Eubacteriales bacterium]|jgi:uncharacterized protein YhaN